MAFRIILFFYVLLFFAGNIYAQEPVQRRPVNSVRYARILKERTLYVAIDSEKFPSKTLAQALKDYWKFSPYEIVDAVKFNDVALHQTCAILRYGMLFDGSKKSPGYGIFLQDPGEKEKLIMWAWAWVPAKHDSLSNSDIFFFSPFIILRFNQDAMDCHADIPLYQPTNKLTGKENLYVLDELMTEDNALILAANLNLPGSQLFYVDRERMSDKLAGRDSNAYFIYDFHKYVPHAFSVYNYTGQKVADTTTMTKEEAKVLKNQPKIVFICMVVGLVVFLTGVFALANRD
jgi:hypothetical protein